MRFLVSIPAWGDWYVRTATHAAIPSVLAAIKFAGADARFVIHTDDPVFLPLPGTDWLPLPAQTGVTIYHRLGECHRQALAVAREGECVCLMCADMVISREAFDFAKWAMTPGKHAPAKAIAVVSPRTLIDPERAAVDLDGPALAQWSIDNAHPWTWQHLYGSGLGSVPSTLYFKDDNGISVHAFHLHPLFVLNDRPLAFDGAAIDVDLLERFTEDEVEVVTDLSIAACDVSPAWRKPYLGPHAPNIADIASWASRNATKRHRWQFKHRIVLTGEGADSQPIADRILEAIAAA